MSSLCPILLLVLVAACAAPTTAVRPLPAPAGPTSQPTTRAPGARTLAKDLRLTVLESYRVLSGGYEEAYLDGLAHDPELTLLGIGPADVTVGFSPDASVLVRIFASGEFQLVSKSLDVRLSRDLTVGWIRDELSYRMTHRGLIVSIPLRMTAVYERRDDRWILAQQHVSYGLAEELLFAPRKDGRATWRPLALAGVTDKTSELALRPLVEGIIRYDSPADIRARVDDAAFVVGILPGRTWSGGSAAEGMSPRAQLGLDLATRPVDLRIQLSRTGTVAWAVADLVVEGVRGDRAVELNVRASWVLEHQGEVWKIVQGHLQVPVSREEIAQAVFGASRE